MLPHFRLFSAVMSLSSRMLFPELSGVGEVLELAKDAHGGNRGSFPGPDSSQSF